jgi:Spy/CpxP family protein refolding chaperone
MYGALSFRSAPIFEPEEKSMAFPKRSVLMGLVMALMVALGTIPLAAQDNPPGKKSDKADAPATKGSGTRRLPNFFGQIGLSLDQRESVYKVLAKHQEQIEVLEKQLVEARTDMMRDCESVLTAPQKQLLEQRRSAPREPRVQGQTGALAPAKKTSAP